MTTYILYITIYIEREMIHDTQSALISQKQDGHNIYTIMKTIYPPSYHHSGFLATYALGQNDIVLVICCSLERVHESF